MKVKALVGFSGLISMHKGEETEITDQEVLDDLLSANYVEEINTTQSNKERPGKEDGGSSNTTTPKNTPPKQTPVKKAAAQKPGKKGVKSNESK